MEYIEYVASEGNRLIILGEFKSCKRILCPMDSYLDIIECPEETALELETYGESIYAEYNSPITEDNVDEILEKYADTPMLMTLEEETVEELSEIVKKFTLAETLRNLAFKQKAAYFLLDRGYDVSDLEGIIHE